MPVPSNLAITVAGVDITKSILYPSARFEAQASGGVGTFSFTVKDPTRTKVFTTGSEVVLTLDSKKYFAGYLMQVGGRHAFSVVDTTTVSAVTDRQFALSGVNYNVLFDRLVVRNTSDYLRALDPYPGTSKAGALVRDLVNYLDLPSGFDITTYVDDVGRVHPYSNDDFALANGGEQGQTWRAEMEQIRSYNGAIYYIDANKKVHFHAPENSFSRWGFSDRPNKATVSHTATNWTGATYGFREMETDEDITDIVNDIFVWTGSSFQASDDPGSPSGIFFARRTNQTSIDTYGRWQNARVELGSDRRGTQEGADALADAIVPPNNSDIPPGVDLLDGIVRNASKPNKTLKLTWYAHDVPTMTNGVKDHLTPGDIVTILLYVHGTGPAQPLVLTLPLRRVSMTFPTLPGKNANPTGASKTYVRFDGEFGLSLSDPWNLWEAILHARRRTREIVRAAGSPTGTGSPGGIWQGAPDESPNGTRKTFTLSSNGTPIVFAAATSEVYVGALRLRLGADYSENPSSGTITLFSAPSTGSTFWVIVRLAG